MGFYSAKIHHEDSTGILTIIVEQIIKKSPLEIAGSKTIKLQDGLWSSGKLLKGLQGKFCSVT